MAIPVSAAMLYDFVKCPHRVELDIYGDPKLRDPVSAFMRLLWDRGHAFEQELIEGLKVRFLNLRHEPSGKRIALTLEAMTSGDELIYGGRILSEDMVGEPDLLRRHRGGYVAGDIKSGAGLEGGTEDVGGKPKPHYAVQLAFYTEILEQLGVSGGRIPFVWDIDGKETTYELDSARGPRASGTLWSEYKEVLAQVRAIASGGLRTTPAFMGDCRLCHWRTACARVLEEQDDLTKIPQLGRAKRDALVQHFRTVQDLAHADLDLFIGRNKTSVPGVGIETLRKFQARARLQVQADSRPYFEEKVSLPVADVELFFDVETDPLRDLCYLHGFFERKGGVNGSKRYVPFFADEPTSEAEESAFAQAWEYVASQPGAAIYYYSHYERTTWRKLAKRYSGLPSEEDVLRLFKRESAVDLCTDVVQSKMIWPTRDHSLKTIARYLGFEWRDKDPSGTASIEWYHRWVETRDADIRRRILEYNEDDCVAMRFLLDALRAPAAG